jgi:leucyl-tRNA---protein transferase
MDHLTILSEPSVCEYLSAEVSQVRHDVLIDLTPEHYSERLLSGWRRFGPFVFRPECPSCRKCLSIRVPVNTFRSSETQRRVWKNNADVEMRVGSPSSSPEKLDLFARFHEHGHRTKGWPKPHDADLRVFLANPFRTEEWSYYVGKRLCGIAYVDALPAALSAIYFFHDPAEGRRSLGTFNILATIAAARERGLPHVYLGYYVEGCRSLEYKAAFRPNEVLTHAGWQAFRT